MTIIALFASLVWAGEPLMAILYNDWFSVSIQVTNNNSICYQES
nr:MAG TPA: hypothetical protein [Caudoviricetes sp.]